MSEYNSKVKDLVGHKVEICISLPTYPIWVKGEVLWVEEFDLCIQRKGADEELIYNRDHIIYIKKL